MTRHISWQKMLLFFAIQFLFLVTMLYAQDPFVAIVSSDRAASKAVAWGDYDNDGYPDYYVTNGAQGFKQQNFLYHNNGDGTFTKITSGPQSTDQFISGGCSWGDFDNDGDLDLYVATTVDNFNDPLKENFLYENNGDGTFTKNTTAGPPVTDKEYTAVAGWGDYNNDGFIDLFVKNGYVLKQANSLYSNNGDGTFVDIAGIDLVSSTYGTFISGFAWGDYDNDGDLDLCVAGGAGPNNAIWRNDGNNTFVRLLNGSSENIIEASDSSSPSWADFDNDGDLDIFMTNFGDAGPEKNFLYRNDGNDTFTKITDGDIVNDVAYSLGSAWADIDNDGDLDLFVGNDNDGTPGTKNFFYLNNGDGTFTKNTTSSVLDSTFTYGTSFADYNKDGFLDLFTAREGKSILFKNNEPANGNTNHWINIKCVGTTSNKAGIGAKVRVKATINSAVRWQMREISAQSGYGGHDDLRAHFGIGNATTIDELQVEWPSGNVQTLTSVAVNQFLTITESGTAENIHVTAPNGGETWQVGSVHNITWTSSNTSGTVDIDYSINGGSAWNSIASNETDDGSYSWTIPNNPSTSCLVRITDTDNDPTDVSDAVFTISQNAFDISGAVIYDAKGRPVSDVTLALTHTGGSGNQTTDVNGEYLFTSVPVGNVQIVPSKTDDLREAIMGSDALLVLENLAFLASLNADQQFAADVTEDSKVTGSDAQAILRYLAFYADNIGNTGQWRFIPSDTSFTLNTNADADFKAYLKGDANLDWNQAPGLAKSTVTSNVALNIDQVTASEAKDIIVPVSVELSGETANTVIFSLSYNPLYLRYLSTEKTLLTEQFMVVDNGEEPGKIHIAMAGIRAIQSDGEILRLNFETVGQPETTEITITRAIINDFKVTKYHNGQINFHEQTIAVIPENFNLDQNYPNPFNPETRISYQLPESRFVVLKIYNVRGDEVCTLVAGKQEAGNHQVSWNGKDVNGIEVPSGVYLLTIHAGDFRMNRKMIKVR